VLLGLSEFSADRQGHQLEGLLGTLDASVVFLRSGVDWKLTDAKKILIPTAGRGGHESLLALLLGRLLRTNEREVTFLRVLPTSAKADEVRIAKRDLRRLADDAVRDQCHVEVVQSDDALTTIASHADASDLLILGVQRLGRRKKLFGNFTRQIAQRTRCPIIAMSRRG
jgi:nucleotide-binding universal stress UspA family protein